MCSVAVLISSESILWWIMTCQTAPIHTCTESAVRDVSARKALQSASSPRYDVMLACCWPSCFSFKCFSHLVSLSLDSFLSPASSFRFTFLFLFPCLLYRRKIRSCCSKFKIDSQSKSLPCPITSMLPLTVCCFILALSVLLWCLRWLRGAIPFFDVLWLFAFQWRLKRTAERSNCIRETSGLGLSLSAFWLAYFLSIPPSHVRFSLKQNQLSGCGICGVLNIWFVVGLTAMTVVDHSLDSSPSSELHNWYSCSKSEKKLCSPLTLR